MSPSVKITRYKSHADLALIGSSAVIICVHRGHSVSSDEQREDKKIEFSVDKWNQDFLSYFPDDLISY